MPGSMGVFLLLPKDIRTFTELNRYAIREGLAASLRVFYVCRQHNHDQTGGNGWMSKAEYMKLVTKGLRLSERQAHNIYNQGEGIFWRDDPNRTGYILLVSVINVGNYFAEKYGLINLGYSVHIQGRRFRKLSTFKAYIFAAWFARDTWKTVNNKLEPTGGKIISKRKLADLFGVSESTIKNWTRILSYKPKNRRATMTKTPVYGYAKTLTNKDQAGNLDQTYIPEHIAEGKRKPNYFDIDQDGTKELFWQLPNKLAVPKLEGFRAWHNRKLGSFTKRTEAAKRERLYHDQTPKVRGAKERAAQRSVYVLNNKKRKQNEHFEPSYLIYQAVVI